MGQYYNLEGIRRVLSSTKPPEPQTTLNDFGEFLKIESCQEILSGEKIDCMRIVVPARGFDKSIQVLLAEFASVSDGEGINQLKLLIPALIPVIEASTGQSFDYQWVAFIVIKISDEKYIKGFILCKETKEEPEITGLFPQKDKEIEINEELAKNRLVQVAINRLVARRLENFKALRGIEKLNGQSKIRNSTPWTDN